MVQGCSECFAAIVDANQALSTEGEVWWLITPTTGHSHFQKTTLGLVLHLTEVTPYALSARSR